MSPSHVFNLLPLISRGSLFCLLGQLTTSNSVLKCFRVNLFLFYQWLDLSVCVPKIRLWGCVLNCSFTWFTWLLQGKVRRACSLCHKNILEQHMFIHGFSE